MNTGRIVVITAAVGGVGSQLSTRFLANGDTVSATDNAEDALDRLRGNIEHPDKLIVRPPDITSEEDCDRLADTARSDTGRVDAIINCAGYFPIVPFEQIEPDDWRKVTEVNLTGSYLLVVAAKAGIVGSPDRWPGR